MANAAPPVGITLIPYHAPAEADQIRDCGICTDPINEEQVGRIGALAHEPTHPYCEPCIMNWLKQKRTESRPLECPSCRRKISRIELSHPQPPAVQAPLLSRVWSGFKRCLPSKYAIVQAAYFSLGFEFSIRAALFVNYNVFVPLVQPNSIIDALVEYGLLPTPDRSITTFCLKTLHDIIHLNVSPISYLPLGFLGAATIARMGFYLYERSSIQDEHDARVVADNYYQPPPEVEAEVPAAPVPAPVVPGEAVDVPNPVPDPAGAEAPAQ